MPQGALELEPVGLPHALGLDLWTRKADHSRWPACYFCVWDCDNGLPAGADTLVVSDSVT